MREEKSIPHQGQLSLWKRTSDTEKSRTCEDGAGIRGRQGWRNLRPAYLLSAAADYSSHSVMGESRSAKEII